MINIFFKQIKEHLETDLPWLDHVGGNVTFLKGEKSIIPISCFSEECKANTQYLLPGNGANNILFFEFLSTSKNLKDSCTEINQINFNLFFWFNCETLDVEVNTQDIECCEKIDIVYNEIVKSLNKLGVFSINGVQYNVTANYLSDRTRFFPYFNFKISLTTQITFNPCDYSNVNINIKQC